jgi:hypothetical protein
MFDGGEQMIENIKKSSGKEIVLIQKSLPEKILKINFGNIIIQNTAS